MKKLKLLLAFCALLLGWSSASAQASYNHTYTQGVTVAVGTDYFLYNVGSQMFLADGMDWGAHATTDHAGRKITFAEVASGKYSIYTESYSVNNDEQAKAGFMTTNGYLDTGTNDAEWVFTPVSVDGYTNVYTIKNSDTQYLHFNADDCRVNVGESTNNNYSYWIIVPKTARDAVGDYTYYLMNTDMNRPWERKVWAGLDNNNQIGGNAANRCAERYHAAVDISQTIAATVPNGRYKVYAQGFWRQDGSSAGPDFYANSDKNTLGSLTGTENSMTDASNSFSEGKYVNSVETFVRDGNLKVGINITANDQWVIFDNFTLDYLGQMVQDYAVALPAGGAMAADTWYYFDIAVAGNEYNATATTLGDIICTDDGYALTSAASGNVTLNATNNSFAVKRYYVKSSSDNNLVVAAASYSYEVGDATVSIADGSYIDALSTITFTFADASTNDPGASFALLNGSAKAILTKGGENVAEGTLSLSGKVLTATFSDVELARSSTYDIAIAAGVVGYEGEETNAAINTSFRTGVIADGVYYFKKKGEYKYLTRGGNYGTETVVDNYGISLQAMIQSDGTYYLKNVDHSLAANTDKYLNMYTDQGAYAWTIAEATGGYYLKYTNGNYMTTAYVDYEDDNGNTNRYYYKAETANEGEAIVWELLSKAEYATSLTAKKNAEITALATAAGIEGVTTLAGLESVLSSDYGTTDKTSKISNSLCSSASGWTAVSYNGGSKYTAVDYHAPTIQIWNAVGGITQTVSELPAGLYKITVSATWRPGNSTDATRVGNEANTTAWIYANDNITQLKGWYEGGGTINSTQNLVDNAASYLNTVYVYLNGSEDLKIGVAVPSFCQQNWCPIYNWTLTYYEAKATPAEKTALADAIAAAESKTLGFEDGEYAPYNNVAAIEALATAKAIEPATASSATVVAATTALTGATWTANDGDVEAVFNGSFSSDVDGDWGLTGWTRTNNWGQQHNDLPDDCGSITNYGYYNQPGSLKYGNTGAYIMPLKANTIYNLTFKYASWAANSNNGMTVSVLNGGEGMAAMAFPENNTQYNTSGAFAVKTLVFATGAAGNYVLTLANSGNTVITDVSITKAASQVLEFADGSAVPTYAPGTYPSVKITRNLTANRWATAVYPFAISTTDVDEIAVLARYNSEAAIIGFDNAASSTANKPFLMRSTTAKSEITLSNVAVAAASATNAEAGDASLVGSYANNTAVTENAGNYILSNNTIYPVGANVTVNAYRAYINIADTNHARALRFVVGEITGVDNVEAATEATLKDGKYLENGKVVIVKNGKKFNANGQQVK